MEFRLEIVARGRRMAVYDLGRVEAPQSLTDFALPRATVHAMVAAVQHDACAGLREAALRANALDLCMANPQIRLKDYRRRNVATLFDTRRFACHGCSTGVQERGVNCSSMRPGPVPKACPPCWRAWEHG